MRTRREFIQTTLAVAACATVPACLAEPPPLEIEPGPQLFLDDYFIEKMDGLKREVRPPHRHGPPILDSKHFGTWQPYTTVLRDEERGRYRIWYNRGQGVWEADSKDAIHWENPRSAWDLPRCYGASLVDDGPAARDPSRRYKLANWQATRSREDKAGDNSGMWVGFSPDGSRWSGYDKNPVLPMWPQGYGKWVKEGVGDIIDVFWDPIRKCYAAALKTPAVAEDGYKAGPRAGAMVRRLVGMSTSADFVRWKKPWRILWPDEKDPGLLEFYGMGAIHLRGSLYIGLARVLHDDYACDTGGPKNGIGYAALVTSRDGVKWTRYREPFLDRNMEPGSWDHAMTWIGSALPVGDEMFFYYGGYARGHKVEAMKERQIGLARMKKDRYVALRPGGNEGRLVTSKFLFPGGRVTLNADASGGRVRVKMIVDGGASVEAEPIDGDRLAAGIKWSRNVSSLRGKPVRLQIDLRGAEIFGLEFQSA